MAKSFRERNQTETAKRKLKSLAKTSNLDVDFVTALANFTWDYDPDYGTEAAGWVNRSPPTKDAKAQLEFIARTVGLPVDFQLTRDDAANALIAARDRWDPAVLWPRFLTAGPAKHYPFVSEFASFFYLRGLNQETVMSLSWKTKSVGLIDVASDLFLKLFRGGAIERDQLAYLWCDLTLPLPYRNPPLEPACWLGQLLDNIAALPASSSLTDLLGCCKGLVGGDKFFKQEILQALTYADVLQVKGLPVTSLFLAEHRNELSPHFYSNEWTFPLRFWSTNGGRVHRAAVQN